MRSLAIGLAILLLAASPALASLSTPTEPTPNLVLDVMAAAQGGADQGAVVARTLRAIAQAEGVQVPTARPCPSLQAAIESHASRLGIAVPAVPVGLGDDLRDALACLLGALHQ